jgi:hypothetical protein
MTGFDYPFTRSEYIENFSFPVFIHEMSKYFLNSNG